MPLIELILGFPTVQHQNNQNWSFERDRAGRYVCDVTDDKAAEIILSVEHYRVVEPLDDAPQPPKIPQQKPAGETLEIDEANLSDEERARLALERKMNMTDAERAAFEEAEQRAAQKKADEEAAAAKARAAQEAADKAAADAQAKEEAAKGQLATTTTSQTTAEMSGAEGDKPAITDIKGIGDKMAEKLATKGITEVEQLATLSDTMKAVLDEDLKLHGAIDRDDWIGQAKALMAAQPQG